MTRLPRLGLLIALATVLLSAVAGALPRDDDPWYRLRTRHFEIVSNAEPAQIQSIARQLDGLRSAIARVTAFEPVSPVPIRLYLFADDIAMHPYKHRYDGQVAELSGAYYPRPWGDFLTMDGNQRSIAQMSVFHEYLHAVLRNNLPGLPLWLEEGMAELFSTFTVVDGTGRLGRPLPWHPHTLKSGERLDLAILLGLDTDSVHYNRFEHQGELYARSWELAHYLLLDLDRRRQLLQYLGSTFGGATPADAFRQAFGITPQAMEERLLAYRRHGYPQRSVPIETVEDADRRLVPRPMGRAEVLVALGDLLVAQGERTTDATFHFEAALKVDPRHAAAWVGLGVIAELDRDVPRARALYRRALDADPNEPQACFRYGASLLQLGRATPEAIWTEARQHLERSIALTPGFAPAWVELNRALRLTDRADEVVVPAQGEVALQLLLLHSRNEDRAAARAVWRAAFEDRPDDRLRRSAAAVLERIDWLASKSTRPLILVRPPDEERPVARPPR